MAEVRALPWNGLNVVSTFSGCGGSCLGYRMAGFRVLWASEFIDAAAECYAANHPTSHLDRRDIREVQPADILKTTRLKAGELDLLDGSPPCAAFSTCGIVEDGWGRSKKYSDKEQRVDDLFFEYARILDGLQPKVFVAENVAGLVKGKAIGYFKDILKRLSVGYDVEARVVDAQWLGVPQTRSRLIFIGVRRDLGVRPVFPSPLPYQYTTRDAIPWSIPVVVQLTGAKRGARQDVGRSAYLESLGVDPEADYTVEPETWIEDRMAIAPHWQALKPGQSDERYFNLCKPHPDKPVPCVTASGSTSPGTASVCHPYQQRKFSIAELRRICSFPPDFDFNGTYAQNWERMGRAVPPLMMRAIASTVRDAILLPLKEAGPKPKPRRAK